jgi:hypothetical protein
MSRYPTMKTQTVKLRNAPDYYIDATIDVMTGKPLIVLDSEAAMVEDINLSPAEAERLARVLMKAAAIGRAKAAHARKAR